MFNVIINNYIKFSLIESEFHIKNIGDSIAFGQYWGRTDVSFRLCHCTKFCSVNQD